MPKTIKKVCKNCASREKVGSRYHCWTTDGAYGETIKQVWEYGPFFHQIPCGPEGKYFIPPIGDTP